MPNDKETAEKSLSLIIKHFDIEEKYFNPSEIEKSEDPLEQLKKQLSKVVSYLIENDFTKLINALYKIDVDERKIKEVLASEKPHLISEKIADLILQREKEKVITRLKYKNYS